MAQFQASNPGADFAQAHAMISDYRELPMAVLVSRPSRFDGAALRLGDGRSLPLEEVCDVAGQ